MGVRRPWDRTRSDVMVRQTTAERALHAHSRRRHADGEPPEGWLYQAWTATCSST